MGITYVFDVEVKVDGDGEVYRHYLEKTGSHMGCSVAIQKALSDILYELLEEKVRDEKEEV